MELFKNTNFDFLGKKWPFIILSLILTAAGLVSLAIKGGPRYGIDFRGGALVTVTFAQRPPVDKVRAALSSQGPNAEVQEVAGKPDDIIGIDVSDDNALQTARQTIVDSLTAAFGQPANGKYNINSGGAAGLADRLRDRCRPPGVRLSEQAAQRSGDQHHGVPQAAFRPDSQPGRAGSVPGVTPEILNVFKQQTYADSLAVVGTEVVGPKIGAELQRKAVLAVLYALGGMLVYIAFRFEWIYGAAAVIAVFHDTIITIGLVLAVQQGDLSDRGRGAVDSGRLLDERHHCHVRPHSREPEDPPPRALEPLINLSVNQTLSRTVLTSGLTLLTALALFLFGGQVLNGFAFALVWALSLVRIRRFSLPVRS